MNNCEANALMAIVQTALSELMEHFEVVQIFASSYDKDTMYTTSIALGEGNYNARLGQVNEWLREKSAQSVTVHVEQQ